MNVNAIKEKYVEGMRIELIHMYDVQAVPSGTKGTVEFVDDMGTIHMHWDNGRTLALIPGEDSFRKLTPEEIAQEQEAQEQQMEGMECQTL